MRRIIGVTAAIVLLALPVALASPAHAAGTASMTDNGDGTVTVTWSGIAGTPPNTSGSIVFCSTSIAASSCNFANRLYQIGGFGTTFPVSGTVIGVGATVYSAASSSITTLPDGTFNMNLYETPAPTPSLATLSNAVIGTGVTPSGGSSSASTAPPQIVQQFGRPASGTCEAVASSDLNWGGAESGGWSESWAEWMNGGLGGAVCTRTLTYRSSTGVWSAA